MSEILFLGGIVVCVIAIFSAIIAVIALRISKARLNRLLDSEYGERRH